MTEENHCAGLRVWDTIHWIDEPEEEMVVISIDCEYERVYFVGPDGSGMTRCMNVEVVTEHNKKTARSQ